MDNTAYVSELDEEVEAESFARIRNGLVIEVTGKVGKMVDYYRRDPEGNPLPVKKVKAGPPEIGGLATFRGFPGV